MTTSRDFVLSEIRSGDPISPETYGYFEERLRDRIHELILAEFERLRAAGEINNATLARRLGREAAQVTRWLRAPGNLTLKTISNLFVAMETDLDFSVSRLAAKLAPRTHSPHGAVDRVRQAGRLGWQRSILPSILSSSAVDLVGENQVVMIKRWLSNHPAVQNYGVRSLTETFSAAKSPLEIDVVPTAVSGDLLDATTTGHLFLDEPRSVLLH